MTAQIEWLQSSVADELAFPAAPWEMVGSMWLSVFRLGSAVDDRHPAGGASASGTRIYTCPLVEWPHPESTSA